MKQRTIGKDASVKGKALHTGQDVTLTIKPGAPNTGIVFRRTDVFGKPEIRPVSEMVTELERKTTVTSDTIKLHTIEHVLSALSGMSIDNAIVELDAFAHLNGPGLEVGRRRERLGQIGNGIALGVDGGQGVEHHVGHEETRSRQGRRGRVQSVDVGLDSVAKRATGNGVAFGFGGRCFGGGALVAGATIGCLGVARAAAVIVATTGNGEDHEARKRRAEDTPRAQFA